MHQRTDRVASLLMQEVSQAIREDIHQDGLGFVTLSRIEVSKDIKSARVFYSVMGSDEDKKRTDLIIQSQAKEIKRVVNNRVRLRYAVDLKFIREEGIEHAFKIQKILDKIEEERGDDEPTDEPKEESV